MVPSIRPSSPRPVTPTRTDYPIRPHNPRYPWKGRSTTISGTDPPVTDRLPPPPDRLSPIPGLRRGTSDRHPTRRPVHDTGEDTQGTIPGSTQGGLPPLPPPTTREFVPTSGANTTRPVGVRRRRRSREDTSRPTPTSRWTGRERLTVYHDTLKKLTGLS